MPAVCLYFQIHQPFRLRKYTVFDADSHYFDNAMNAQLTRRIAERCYIPMNRLLLELIRRHHAPSTARGNKNAFRLALSVTGTALEQFESYAPEVVQGLHALAETGAVEFLGETFYHSLAGLKNVDKSSTEFKEQVELHRRMIKRLFGQTPTVFRNTELIYSNDIGTLAGDLGFRALMIEGWEPVLNNRSASFLYRAVAANKSAEIKPADKTPDSAASPDTPATPPPAARPPLLILRNHRLSDAISYRFADAASPDFPMTDEKFATLVMQVGGRLCNLFMDYETFGEHQAAATGIFDFLRSLPEKLLEQGCTFALPSEIIASGGSGADGETETAGELDVPIPISWADEARDLGAWLGNAMQTNALEDLYALEAPIKKKGDPKLLADWRKLTTSDHFYYMSTKDNADGGVHAYFRPYESPYDAYINFMNVLDNLRARASS